MNVWARVLIAIATIVGAMSAATPASADQILSDGGLDPDAYGGYISWHEQRADQSDAPKLWKNGTTSNLDLPPNRLGTRGCEDCGFWSLAMLDLGPGPGNKPAVAYAVCPDRKCKFRARDLASGKETTLASLRLKRGRSIKYLAISGRHIFVVESSKRSGRCGTMNVVGGCDRLLDLTRDRIRERAFGVDITALAVGPRFLVWQDENDAGLITEKLWLTDRRTGKSCKLDTGYDDEGSGEDDLPSSFSIIEDQSVTGRYAYWREKDDSGTSVLYRRAGCKGRTQRSSAKGAVMNSGQLIATDQRGIVLLPAPHFSRH